MKNVGSGFASVAVMLLVVSSALPLAQQTKASSNSNRDVVQKHEPASVWHVRSNGCALGNDPPPGANCSR